MHNELHERTEEILFSLIRQYIKTGEPVGSETLFKEYDFGIRPAMIRAELVALEGDGWLLQPHTSSGRMPTDMALERFATVAQMNSDDSMEAGLSKRIRNANASDGLDGIVNELADALGMLCVAYVENDAVAYKRGLDELFRGLDTEDADVYSDIAELFEGMDRRIQSFAHRTPREEGVRVYIGEKSPLMPSRHVATICDAVSGAQGRRVIMIGIGPKRMDYEKGLGVFLELRDILRTVE